MPLPFGGAIAAIGRVMASTYGRALASRATPFISQYLRGFGRSMIPAYGTVSNLAYASRLSKQLAAARISGAVSADIALGGMAGAYIAKGIKKSIESPSSLRKSGRSRRRRRYLEE